MKWAEETFHINSSGKNTHYSFASRGGKVLRICCLITGAVSTFQWKCPHLHPSHPFHPLHSLRVCKVHPSVAFSPAEASFGTSGVCRVIRGGLFNPSILPHRKTICLPRRKASTATLYLSIRTLVLHTRVYASIVVSSPFTTRRLSS